VVDLTVTTYERAGLHCHGLATMLP
jgi:hypothetical protein